MAASYGSAMTDFGSCKSTGTRLPNTPLRAKNSLQTGQEEGAVLSLSAADYALDAVGFYYYSGSLTAPPFSEPVQWYVSRTIKTVSRRKAEQLQALTNGPNGRPMQDRNVRSIVCVGCEM